MPHPASVPFIVKTSWFYLASLEDRQTGNDLMVSADIIKAAMVRYFKNVHMCRVAAPVPSTHNQMFCNVHSILLARFHCMPLAILLKMSSFE